MSTDVTMTDALEELRRRALNRGAFDSGVTLKLTGTRWLAEYRWGPLATQRLFASDEKPELAVIHLADRVVALEGHEGMGSA